VEENMQAFNLSFYSQSNWKAQCSESKTGSGMQNETTKTYIHTGRMHTIQTGGYV